MITGINFYILTGGPGVGKTTLLNGLRSRGYVCIKEVAREVIKQQMQKNGDALPWKNKELYTKLMLDASIKSYNCTLQSNSHMEPVFFDRGILDTICYAHMIGLEIPEKTISHICRLTYNPNVFILPPWKEIYQKDEQRKQEWKEVMLTYEKMKQTYTYYGYNIIEVPENTVCKRVEFILSHL